MISRFDEYRTKPYLFCYNDKEEYIVLEDVIGEHEEQFVFRGKKSDGENVMVKWTKNPQELEDEIDNMIRAETIGVKLPKFDDSFFFWDVHVLVEEILEPIDGEDDAYEIGKQLLPSLHKLHYFGVHNDIKPGNIMKRGNEYLLIDYGGLAFIPKLYGFVREIWTPLWASQVKEAGQITTAKNDLMELIYVLHYQDALKQGIYIDEDDYKNVYIEKWKALLDQVRDIDERNIKKSDYESLYRFFGIKIDK
jgi:tRNA A-37 threonylcarbamoyl transferase component Bud32